MKTLEFCDNFDRTFSSLFKISWKFYQGFRENLGKFKKYLEMCISKGFRGGPRSLLGKSKETSNFLKICMNSVGFFY